MFKLFILFFSLVFGLVSDVNDFANTNTSMKEEMEVTTEESTTIIEVTTKEQTTKPLETVTKPVEEETTTKVEETTTKVEVTTKAEATTKEETTTKAPEKKPVEEVTTSKPSGRSHKIEFKAILQLPELPTGCEITSLTMVLNHLGVKADKLDLADNYLLKGEVGKVHPNEYFLGNPRDDKSFGCYAPVIVKTAEAYLKAKGREDLTVYNLTGTKFEDLFTEIDAGNPIVIWATIDMRNSRLTRTWNINGKDFTWRSPEHCLVITGYDTTANKVYVADPLKGNVSYNLETFKNRYEQLYNQAVVIK